MFINWGEIRSGGESTGAPLIVLKRTLVVEIIWAIDLVLSKKVV